jgi:hypothetical protein
MLKHHKMYEKSIRFRRWSRKNYAVFAGLNKVISIGRVGAGICDQAILKTNLLSASDAYSVENTCFTEEEEEEKESFLFDLLFNTNTLNIATDAPVGCREYYLLI